MVIVIGEVRKVVGVIELAMKRELKVILMIYWVTGMLKESELIWTVEVEESEIGIAGGKVSKI